MAPSLSSRERIRRRNEALERWKEKNWERYLEQKKRLESGPENLAKRRARYAERERPPRNEEDALERRRHLSRLRPQEYGRRTAKVEEPKSMFTGQTCPANRDFGDCFVCF